MMNSVKSNIEISKGEKISLTVNLGVNSPNKFDVVQATSKALLLKACTGKTTWIPKSKISWDQSWECHFIKQNFRVKMSALQTAVLVCN